MTDESGNSGTFLPRRIESELLKAVGRAGVLTEDCIVRVHGNLPLRGATHGV